MLFAKISKISLCLSKLQLAKFGAFLLRHGVLRRYLSLVCEYIYNVYRGVVLFMITWYQLLLVNIVIVMT